MSDYIDTPANLAIRFDGCMAALNHVHPLCNPYLTGPEASKREWLLGYGFAQKLSALDQAKLRVELLERQSQARARGAVGENP